MKWNCYEQTIGENINHLPLIINSHQYLNNIFGKITSLTIPVSRFFFFPGGFPQQQKFCPSPATNCHPCFLTRACPPPPTEFCPWKFQKFYLIFSLNFDYFLAQNCIRKLYFMLKNTKICSNFAVGGHFWPQRTIFLSPPMWVPPSDSVPNRDRKIVPKSKFPPKKKICEKTLVSIIAHILWIIKQAKSVVCIQHRHGAG